TGKKTQVVKQTIKILTYYLLLLFPFASQAQLTQVPVQKGYEIPYILGEAFTINYKTYFGCWTGELGKEGVRLCYIENDTIKLLPNPEFKPHSQNAFLGFYNYSELEANNFNSNGYAGKPVFFKDKAYMAFQEFSGRHFLTSFDGKDFSFFDTLKRSE